ncbi:MAG TPA: translational GTPase TypA [Herpetosiphon sp.]|uniref:Large ribosomal subunit assembly factor BipA n=1 Tax=Herpetosiphon aurantiacus (strain ATCC 23779 / DSM 785 / 114-95) TaxID=316274 RepID=A9B0I8_HERA2|nr:translational GTPase TypA [Herpetosiphon sp.]ABX07206.1 GTP-binding protein TypA [Herpetosiphon aurantiacus DSM 785]HBW51133.1 translational GTPase TypA [Herpetosiphon sp.]
MQRTDLRNIAIIAHVDHGKTTLVDAMLKQSRIFRDNQQVAERVMDSNAIERERGITIMAKNTAVEYNGVRINIVDTPGHADFGGEVERVLNMVDGVLLLVDAVEGPMPQTKFVLRKALEQGHRAIVVVNKVDRPSARPNYVVNETFDLFIDLGATEEQAEFPIVYASGIAGTAGHDPHAMQDSLTPLFETILQYVPAPDVDAHGPPQLLVTSTMYDDYKGKIIIGRLNSGTIRKGQAVAHIAAGKDPKPAKVVQVFTHYGMERVEVDEITAGDIVAMTGINDAGIGDTIADKDNPVALPPIKVEEPTVQMTFGVNTSPFSGREGKLVTSRKIRERLYGETERDVALKVEDTDNADTFRVSGRGELHLAILIENMRREGYEFQVSKAEVIYKDIDGTRHEPYELVEIEVDSDYQGSVVELMGLRRGTMRDMSVSDSGSVQFVYHVPTRGLLGFRQQLLTATRGTGIMNSLFAGYQPYAGDVQTRQFGSLIAWEQGVTSSYGLSSAQERGQLFVGSGVDVYEGMIIGQHIRDEDLEVNACKKKQLTNMRSSGADDALRLDVPRNMSLDDCIEYLADDELLEVTPLHFRLRKRILNTDERRRDRKWAKNR